MTYPDPQQGCFNPLKFRHKNLAKQQIPIVRRDTEVKSPLALANVITEVSGLLDTIRGVIFISTKQMYKSRVKEITKLGGCISSARRRMRDHDPVL